MTGRRRYLRGVALAGSALLAGCTTVEEQSDADGNESTGGERTAGVPPAEPIVGAGQPNSTVDTAQSAETGLGLRIDDIRQCGLTCRTFVLTIQNRGEGLSRLTLQITGYTPERGTTEVYSDTLSVGPLPTDHERTGIRQDIDVGIGDGQRIESNDGRVALEFGFVTAGETVETFTFDVRLEG